jgi:hypothetical protein
MDAASTNELTAAHKRRRQEAEAEVAQERGVVGIGDGSGRTWHGGPPVNDHMWVRPGAGFEADGITPTTAHLARNLSLHEFSEGDPVTLEWMSSARGANMLQIVYRERVGTLALYWIGYTTIPAVWKVYRLLPDLVTLEELGKPDDFDDADMNTSGFMFTITGALVVGAGTENVASARLWMPGSGWQGGTAPTPPVGSSSWGLNRNVRIGGSLYQVRGVTISSINYIYIWRLTTLPNTWTLVVTQQCNEMTDLECAWPVEPAGEGGLAYILLATSRGSEPSPELYSEGRVFWRLRVPSEGEAVPIVNQHNPSFAMPLSVSPYNMSVRRTRELEYQAVPDGSAPWFVGVHARDFSVMGFVFYPPIAARYDVNADAWQDQSMNWSKSAPADPPGEYWNDQGWNWLAGSMFDPEGNIALQETIRDTANSFSFIPTVNGWLYATFDGGALHGGSFGTHPTPNTTLKSAAANAHSGPPIYDATADEFLPSKRLIRQRAGIDAEVLASFTLDGTNAYDDTFGFHGTAIAGDGTLLFGIGKGPTPDVSEPHPEGFYSYPSGGVYYVHPSGAILAWPPLQHAFNGGTTGVVRLYSSEDLV